MTLANQYREFVIPLLVKAFANVNGMQAAMHRGFFAENVLKNDHLPVYKT